MIRLRGLSELVSFLANTVVMIVATMKKLSKKISKPPVSPAFKVVLALLVVAVLLALLGHNYLSNMAATDGLAARSLSKMFPDGHNRVLGPNNFPFPEGVHYYTDPEGGRPQLKAYQIQIEELRQIKVSLSNDLRDLESKRLHLQTSIQQYKTSIEELKAQHSGLTREMSQLKLTLEQLRFERDESQSYIPNIRAPVHIIKDADPLWDADGADGAGGVNPEQIPEGFHPSSCSMETCFDFSRCSLVSGFPVYFYDPVVHPSSATVFNESVLATVRTFFKENAYRTNMPGDACVFVVFLGGGLSQNQDPLSFREMERFLYDLPYWDGDGRNHVLIYLSQTELYDPLEGVNTGRALVARTIFTGTAFRDGFDIVIPPNIGPVSGENLWKDLPPLSPIRRKLLLSYWGQIVLPSQALSHNSQSRTKHKRMSEQEDPYVSNNRRRHRKPLAVLQNPRGPASSHKNYPFHFLERAIVSSIEGFSNSVQGEILVDTSCEGAKIFSSPPANSSSTLSGAPLGKLPVSDWSLCGTEQARASVLLHSTFSLVLAPLNSTLDSTLAFQTRVLESLAHGSVPVVVGSTLRSRRLLPFAESLQWESAALTLPVPRITEVPFYLQSYPDEDIAAFRLMGRETPHFGKTHFGTYPSRTLPQTLLAVLRRRLDIPALPILDEPSPSVFPANFTPLAYEGPDVEPDTDEVLGPIETPFASETFRRNFSVGLVSDMFNKFGDPFNLYPHTPFQPVLPSESKFLGSNYGFRPVNRGAGGDGVTFSQALGGNFQREQFTIVMLTYKREVVLMQALQRFKGLPFLNKVIVVWNSEIPPSPELKWPQIGVPIKVVKTERNSLNNRFLPYADIETEAILSIDDDAHLRHDEIVFGFRVWREERNRVVGFPGRYHAWNLADQMWNYNSNYSCELSMILTGAAFFHKYYAFLYSYVMPAAIRDKVDEYLNCEDIAMNFLVSH
ncbi:hypothetical protein EGW08_022909, partial [Elysia chlorotica]